MSNGVMALVPWEPADQVAIPAEAHTADAIVRYGEATLSSRDRASIVSAFQSQSFEMVSTFVWTKASTTLKKQLASLGMEFVGEMLGRPDLNDESDPASVISDHEAILLAEDLGMVTTTQALRLKHAHQLVTHFSFLDPAELELEAMQQEDAISILRTCVTSILGKPRFEVAIRFADFRQRLVGTTMKPDDSDVQAIKVAQYFFIKTTLSVLLTALRTESGVALEHAAGNGSLLIPTLWERLRSQERLNVGQAYAQVNADGNRSASSSLKKALLEVRGFDYVPESLRSNTFLEAASRVLLAHHGLNNFYNEAEPMKVLTSLGSSIPMPALAKCMEAVLAVKMGNYWGKSYAAQPWADRLLGLLRPDQWEYYFNECLDRDRTLLDKLLGEPKPTANWRGIVREFRPEGFKAKDPLVNNLLEVSAGVANAGSNKTIEQIAYKLRLRCMD